MRLWRRLRADMARRDGAVDRDHLIFQVVAAAAILALAQLTEPGSPGTLLLLVLAAAGFALCPLLPRLPPEVPTLVVVVPLTVAVGRDGDLEGALFLSVMLVLRIAWTERSLRRAGLLAAGAAAMPWLIATRLAPDSGIFWQVWVVAHAFTFVLGRTVHRQRVLIDELGAARRALAAQAVAQERRRIARELHDLTGHTLAAMVLHVTGARHVLRRDVDEAEAALRDAEAAGRSGLAQVRATVAALRTDEHGTDPALPGAVDLPHLVEGYRRAGLTIDADLAPEPGALDGPVGVALHRIAREALANVARHAPGNRVELRVSAGAGDVRLVVADRGRPAPPPDAREPHFGLTGMAERARALGGDLVAGPTPDGWRVATRLPLAPARPESAVP